MTIRTSKSEEEYQKRVADAYYAAENGDTWVMLGNGWQMSSAGAMLWCQKHVPEEVWRKISINWLKQVSPNKGRTYHRAHSGKPKADVVPKPRPQPNQACKYLYYAAALNAVVECEAPTNGKTYCRACEQRRAEAPTGQRYAQFGGPSLGYSRRVGSAA